MAFIDDITIHATAGRGGDGIVRWLRLKGMARGGPSGGDGGRGGDIIIEGVRDLSALSTYQFSKKFRAINGEPGGENNKHGGSAPPVILKVPIGTVVQNGTTKETFEVLTEGEQTVIFQGGNGGLGNPHFKGSENQNPMLSTPGKAGKSGDIRFTLKIIADAGLIGFPNAGKSSLLNALTRARSKVGAYPFTTLEPHLGDFFGSLLADIPGLIEGASAGKGLGSKFLRHIERTVIIVHLVSAEQEDPIAAYRAIRNELKTFNPALALKKEIVVLSKTDTVTPEEAVRLTKELSEVSGQTVHPLSLLDEASLKAFSDVLAQAIEEARSKDVSTETA